MLKYQWDKNKAKKNHEKHGILFSDAVSVFQDDLAITIEDDHPGERRFITIGLSETG